MELTPSMKAGLTFCSVMSIVLSTIALVPAVTDLAESVVLCFQSFFKPPYLYLVVNFIILAIAASSRFQESNFNYKNYSNKNYKYDYNLQQHTLPPAAFSPVTHYVSDKDYILNTHLPLSKPMMVYKRQSDCNWEPEVRTDEKVAPLVVEDKFVVSSLKSDTPEPEHTPEFLQEKPVSPAESTIEDKIEAPWTTTATETLESAWSKIIESRRIEKMDTWTESSREMDTNTRQFESQRKSKSFKCKDKMISDPRFSASPARIEWGLS